MQITASPFLASQPRFQSSPHTQYKRLNLEPNLKFGAVVTESSEEFKEIRTLIKTHAKGIDSALIAPKFSFVYNAPTSLDETKFRLSALTAKIKLLSAEKVLYTDDHLLYERDLEYTNWLTGRSNNSLGSQPLAATVFNFKEEIAREYAERSDDPKRPLSIPEFENLKAKAQWKDLKAIKIQRSLNDKKEPLSNQEIKQQLQEVWKENKNSPPWKTGITLSQVLWNSFNFGLRSENQILQDIFAQRAAENEAQPYTTQRFLTDNPKQVLEIYIPKGLNLSTEQSA